MRRHLVNASRDADEASFHKFTGTVYVVDLATINGLTEDFEGKEWLVNRTNSGLPFGWDVEWKPDRLKDEDNPVALIQFADDTTALLIRTHHTRSWLPQSVIKALKSESCRKVGVGYDGNDKMKIQNTFNLQPSNVRDLSVVARRKGLAEQGLKALCEHFGYKPKKDPRCARSDWGSDQLTDAQVRYAADDAYFPFILDHLLEALPDVEVDDAEDPEDLIDRGILQIKKGWFEEGIVRKHDGLYCTTCNQGPMLVPEVVCRHLEGKRHVKKMEMIRKNDAEVVLELPEEWVQQGITLGDGLNGAQMGEYRCTVCEMAIATKLSTEQHIGSIKHKKKIMPPAPVVPTPKKEKPEKPAPVAPEEPEVVPPKDPFEDMLWNMPDYVCLDETRLFCTLCNSQAASCLLMGRHLGGTGHARKCRSHLLEEIYFAQDRNQVEYLNTGRPVVRAGYTAPRKSQVKLRSKESQEKGSAKEKELEKPGASGKQGETLEKPERLEAPPAQQEPARPALRHGWHEAVDRATGVPYYYNKGTGQSTWSLEEAAVEVPEQEKEREAEPPEKEEAEEEDDGLPDGWFETKDPNTGRAYYYSKKGQVQWDRPVSGRRKTPILPASEAAPTACGTAACLASPCKEGGLQSPQPQAQPELQSQQPPGQQQQHKIGPVTRTGDTSSHSGMSDSRHETLVRQGPREMAGELRRKLQAPVCICILGGTAFQNAGSWELTKYLASQVSARCSDSAVFITGGMKGVQETFARHCSSGARVYNLLPQGESSGYGVGTDIMAGADLDERKKVFAEVGDIYITVEGGPGVAMEAALAFERGAKVVPVMRTGGASSGMFDFPQDALRPPSSALEAQWKLLASQDAPVARSAQAAADIVEGFLQPAPVPASLAGLPADGGVAEARPHARPEDARPGARTSGPGPTVSKPAEAALAEPQAAPTAGVPRLTPPKRRLPPGWHVVELATGHYYYGDFHAQVSSSDPPEPYPYVQDDWRRAIDQEDRAFWCRHGSDTLWFYEDEPDWERVTDMDGAVFWATEKHGGVRFFENCEQGVGLREGAAAGA